VDELVVVEENTDVDAFKVCECGGNLLVERRVDVEGTNGNNGGKDTDIVIFYRI
jgi:hypothetical protein